MNKIFILALIVCAAFAHHHHVLEGDVQKCGQDIATLIQVIPKTIEDIEAGNFTAIFQDLQILAQVAGQIKTDCNLTTIGISGKCLQDIAQLVPLVNQTITDINNGNWTGVVQDIIAIVPILEAVIQDCTSEERAFSDIIVERNVQDAQSCGNDIAQLIQLIPQVIQDFESGNFTAIFQDLSALATLINKLQTDCNLTATEIQGISAKCLQDIANLVPLINQTITDINNGNWTGVVQDIIAVVPLLEAVIQDCASAEVPFEFRKTKDAQTCANDVAQLIELIPKVIADFESGNFTAIFQDISTLTTLIQTIQKDCNLTTAELSGISGKCLQDIAQLVPLINQTITDINNGNWTGVIQDIMATVPLLEAVIQDCTSAEVPFEFRKTKDAQTCANDVAQLIEFIPQVVADFESGNFTAIFQDLSALATLINKIQKDCNLTTNEIQGISGKCLQDIANLIPLINQTITDINNGNWTGVVQDIIAVVPILDAVIQDCASAKNGVATCPFKNVRLRNKYLGRTSKPLMHEDKIVGLVHKKLSMMKASNRHRRHF